MLTNIKIKNFKSLENIDLELNTLNVITGINGVGKSSLIQVLLLLRQAYLKDGFRNGKLAFDGELTDNLGNLSDIIFRDAKDDIIEFTIENDNYQQLDWSFDVKGYSSQPFCEGKTPKNVDLSPVSLFSDAAFQYIAAARVTPNSNFGKSINIKHKQFGKTGEHAVEYLYTYGLEKEASVSILVDENILAVANKRVALPLQNQVNYWLQKIANNVQIDIRQKTSRDYELRYKFSTGSFAAINSAYGLTAALPVITALLAAEKGDLVIIENPESDLHPQGQSRMGELIALVAQTGVQIIIETHSDHILNGIRVASKHYHNKPIDERENTGIDCKNVNFFFFNAKYGETSTEIIPIKMNEQGRLSKWPKAFFDEWDNMLDELLD